MNFERFHSPFFSDAVACGIFLARAIIMAMVCSVAASVLPSGALETIMPFFVAASQSMLSTPTPARPMYFILSAASMIRAVTCVPDRTISASYSPMILTSSSSDRSAFSSTSQNPFKISTPSFARGSLTSTLKLTDDPVSICSYSVIVLFNPRGCIAVFLQLPTQYIIVAVTNVILSVYGQITQYPMAQRNPQR